MEELRVAIDCCPDQKAQKRLNAIHLMLCGGSFELTLAHSSVKQRCLQLWIKCFNEAGIDGITYRPKSGRPRLMDTELCEKLFQEVKALLNDPETIRSVSTVKLN